MDTKHTAKPREKYSIVIMSQIILANVISHICFRYSSDCGTHHKFLKRHFSFTWFLPPQPKTRVPRAVRRVRNPLILSQDSHSNAKLRAATYPWRSCACCFSRCELLCVLLSWFRGPCSPFWHPLPPMALTIQVILWALRGEILWRPPI